MTFLYTLTNEYCLLTSVDKRFFQEGKGCLDYQNVLTKKKQRFLEKLVR